MCIYENLHWTLSWIVLVIAWLKLLLLALHVKFFKWSFLVGVNVFDKKADLQITITVLLYFQTMVSLGIPLLTEQFIVIEYSATACIMPSSVSFWTAMFVGLSELNTKIILLYLLSQMHILWQFSFFFFFSTVKFGGPHHCDWRSCDVYGQRSITVSPIFHIRYHTTWLNPLASLQWSLQKYNKAHMCILKRKINVHLHMQ